MSLAPIVVTGTMHRVRRIDAMGNAVYLTPWLDSQNTTDDIIDVPPAPGRFTYQVLVAHYNSNGHSGDVINYAYLTAMVIAR